MKKNTYSVLIGSIIFMVLFSTKSFAWFWDKEPKLPQPSKDFVHDLVKKKMFIIDMNDKGGFLKGPAKFGDDSPWGRIDVTVHMPVISNVKLVKKGPPDHYVADVKFNVATPKIGLTVEGKVYYYLGLDGNIYWEDKAWKQTGSQKFGEW
jgi:hypothetical protein